MSFVELGISGVGITLVEVGIIYCINLHIHYCLKLYMSSDPVNSCVSVMKKLHPCV